MHCPDQNWHRPPPHWSWLEHHPVMVVVVVQVVVVQLVVVQLVVVPVVVDVVVPPPALPPVPSPSTTALPPQLVASATSTAHGIGAHAHRWEALLMPPGYRVSGALPTRPSLGSWSSSSESSG
jgi:hypothetical protein